MEPILIGTTDRTVLVFIPDPASTTGAGKTGLNAAAMTVTYTRVETDNDVVHADVTSSLNDLSALTDAHNDWGWKEVSSTLSKGLYRLDIADAVFASGAWSAVVQVTITSGTAAATPIGFRLVAYNESDSVRMGLTSLPNAAAQASGGLITYGTGAGQLNVTDGLASANILQVYDSDPSADGLARVSNYYMENSFTLPPVASVGSLGTQAKLDVNAEADTALADAKAGYALAIEAAMLNEGDASALLAAISAKVEEFLINEGDAAATLAAIATAVRTNLATELARIDVATSTRMATFAYTAPDNAGLHTAIADIPTVAEFNARTILSADYATSTALAVVDQVADDVKAVTVKMDTMLVLDGVVWQFTANALELGPTGEPATGNGDIAVDHNYGGTDELQILEADTDDPMDDALITAFAGGVVNGQTRTGSDGRWIAPLMLDAGSYTLVISKQGQQAQSVALTVVEA